MPITAGVLRTPARLIGTHSLDDKYLSVDFIKLAVISALTRLNS
jgi:hypothetical protein